MDNLGGREGVGNHLRPNQGDLLGPTKEVGGRCWEVAGTVGEVLGTWEGEGEGDGDRWFLW